MAELVGAVTLTSLLSLSALDIPCESLTRLQVALEGDKHMAVASRTTTGQEICIIDIPAKRLVQRFPIAGIGGLLFHRDRHILALRNETNQTLQVFDLSTKIKKAQYQSPEPVVCWRWTTPTEIMFLTHQGCYNWDLGEDGTPAEPELLFSRPAPTVAAAQTIACAASFDYQWFTAVTLSGSAGKLNSSIQLTSIEQNRSQEMGGSASTFAEFLVGDNAEPSLFYIASLSDGTTHSLICAELSPKNTTKYRAPLPMEEPGDLPIAIIADEERELIYVVTLHGFLSLHFKNAQRLFHTRITQHRILACTDASPKGVVLLTRSGDLIHVAADEQALVTWVTSTSRDPVLINALKESLGMSSSPSPLSPAPAPAAARSKPESPPTAVLPPSPAIVPPPFTPPSQPPAASPPDALDSVEEYVKDLVEKGTCPIAEFISSLEAKGRLRLALPWLKAREKAGDKDPAVHTAIGKVLCQDATEEQAAAFLRANEFYDRKALATYCIVLGKHKLGYMVLAKETCTPEHALHLLHLCDDALWASVLAHDTPFRASLITELPAVVRQTNSAEHLNACIKSLVRCELPQVVIDLLEPLLLYPSPFHDNEFLWLLLAATAIKHQPQRLSAYYNCKGLNAHAEDLAKMALVHQLTEPAVILYQRNGQTLKALQVLCERVLDSAAAKKIAEATGSDEFIGVVNLFYSRALQTEIDKLRAENAALATRLAVLEPSKTP